MLKILRSDAAGSNPQFREVPRKPKEDNLEWLARILPPGAKQSHLILVGGKSPCAFRLRVAQSHLRHDLTPSHWSHAFLLGSGTGARGDRPTYEISLEPGAGFGFPPPENAVQIGRLDTYRDPALYPNIAAITVPVSPTDLDRHLAKFKTQRAVLDSLELLVAWLAYAWGIGRAGNPLLDGLGMPSAAMIEVVVGAAGYELTPGLTSRSSCPEAIWQSATWWHEYYQRAKRQRLSGAWCVTHKLPS
jgi:hypothetical protein